MSKRVKIDIVSDVVCPWCIIGYKHLEAAIKELGVESQLDIEWQPFELNPEMPPEGEELRAHLARKYGSTTEQSEQVRQRITTMGAEYGFEFNYFDGMKMVNTFDAHILLEYAHQHGKQTELKLRLFTAFFNEAQDVSDHLVLRQALTAVGLDADEGMKQLEVPSVRDEVRQQASSWTQAGVTGVPTVIFNRESAITGAHPVESYKQAISSLLDA